MFEVIHGLRFLRGMSLELQRFEVFLREGLLVKSVSRGMPVNIGKCRADVGYGDDISADKSNFSWWSFSRKIAQLLGGNE